MCKNLYHFYDNVQQVDDSLHCRIEVIQSLILTGVKSEKITSHTILVNHHSKYIYLERLCLGMLGFCRGGKGIAEPGRKLGDKLHWIKLVFLKHLHPARIIGAYKRSLIFR